MVLISLTKFVVIFNSSLRKLTQHFMTKNHLAQTAVNTIDAEKHCPEGFFFSFHCLKIELG